MKKIILIVSILLFSQTILFANEKQTAYEYFTIASYEMNRDNYQKALEYYKKFLELEPNNFEARKDILEISISLKNPEIAREYADKLIKEAPKDSKVWGLYGGYQWLLGDVQKAKNAYNKSINLSSDDPAILYQYIMLLAVEDDELLFDYLDMYAKLYPSSAGLLYNEIGKMQINKEKYDTALTLFKKAKSFDKYNQDAYLNIMTVYLLKEQNQNFLKEALALENIGFKSAEFYGELGAFYLKQNNKTKAFEYFDKALVQDKNNIEVNEFLSLYYRKEKDFDKAIYYTTNRRDFETNSKLWLGVSYVSFEAQKPDQAREYLKTAYEKFPDDLEVAYFYATDLYETDAYESYKVLKKVLEKDPSYSPAKRQFAYSAEKVGKYSDMEKTITELLQEDPNNHRLMNFRAYSYSNRGIKLKEAEELSKKALSYDEHDFTFAYKDTLGWIYYKQGELEKAKTEITYSLNNGGQEHSEIWEHLGLILFDMKDYEQSYLCLQKALFLDDTNKNATKYLKKVKRKLKNEDLPETKEAIDKELLTLNILNENK